MLESLQPTLLSSWFTTDVFRRAVDCAIQAFHYLLSQSCHTSEARRTRSIARLVTTMVTTLRASPAYENVAEAMRLNLLIQRLHSGPSTAWALEEEQLQRVFAETLTIPPSRADLQVVLEFLMMEQWGEDGDCLRVCHQRNQQFPETDSSRKHSGSIRCVSQLRCFAI